MRLNKKKQRDKFIQKNFDFVSRSELVEVSRDELPMDVTKTSNILVNYMVPLSILHLQQANH